MARARTQQRMAALVRQWDASGESRRTFARRHGPTVSQFDYWKRRVRRLPGGARLTIPDGVSAATLQTVLTAVRTAC